MNPFTDIGKYNIVIDDNNDSNLKSVLKNREIEHTYFGIEIFSESEKIVYKSRKFINYHDDKRFIKEYNLNKKQKEKIFKRYARTFIRKLLNNASMHGKIKLTEDEISEIKIDIPDTIDRISIGHIQTNGLHSNGTGTTPFYVFVEINDTIFAYIRNLGSNKKRLKPVDIHTMYYYTWKGLEDNKLN